MSTPYKNQTTLSLMRNDYVEQVKSELSEHPALHAAVDWAFGAAASKGFSVLHIPPDGSSAPYSSVNWCDKAIYLSPCGTRGNARLWDLLHELGHVFQGPPAAEYKASKCESSYNREKDAWKLGWRAALEHEPALARFKWSYCKHARRMLRSYKPSSWQRCVENVAQCIRRIKRRF